ncbi:hypothetical protein [Litoreibacter janthinus]|uniref:DUF2799 domain-containing protein n=1 Tax=Litoreibacter janthinus TaxID=670154 RepID=A0A1I6GRE7_9RHOB|nr:hypothetical protein [Litoreibacter janthinus]SFR44651.1 hypothetical protein SAMN04488002_1869 [Litoreibacter janthinus]
MMRVLCVISVVAMSGCALTEGLGNWVSVTPTGKTYRYDGQDYDVYKAVSEAREEGSLVKSYGHVLFLPDVNPEKNGFKNSDVKAVCWGFDLQKCEQEFGKELRGTTKKTREEMGMGY